MQCEKATEVAWVFLSSVACRLTALRLLTHEDIHTIYWHTAIYVTDTHQYLSLEHTNIYSVACRLRVPHT
jgi:hypothetical protein